MAWPSGVTGRPLLPLATAAVLAVGLIALPRPAPAAAEPLPATPRIYISPDCVPGDGVHTVTIRGRNFDRNRLVDVIEYIYYDEEETRTQVTTSDYGTFVATLTMTANTYYYYNYITTSYPGDRTVLASGYVGQCGPRVRALTSCSDDLVPDIHVSGDGWAGPPEPAIIDIGLYQGETQIGKGTAIDARESFDLTWSPGVEVPPGEYTIVVRQINRVSYVDSARFVRPCPVISVTPICHAAGVPPEQMSVMVSGSGFLRFNGSEGEGLVQIVFDPSGEPQEFFYFSSEGLGVGGSFGPVEIRPYARPEGTYTVRVKQQGAGNTIERQQTFNFTVPCTAPPIVVDPTCGPPAVLGDVSQTYPLTITGSGFVPGQKVDIVFDPDNVAGSDYPPESFGTAADRRGTINVAIDPAFRPPGTYRIDAIQDTLLGRFVGSTSFLVLCTPLVPTLIIDPICGPVATNLPAAYSITVIGAGFAPGPVEITFDSASPIPELFSATADSLGAFTASITPNGRPPGGYVLVARQYYIGGVLDEVSTTFVVTCEGVILRITPTSGPRGFVPIVEGFGFPANTALTLTWDFGIGEGVPMTVQTDETGSFTRQVLVFHADFLGLRHLTLQQPTDPTAFTDLITEYLVVQGTVMPPFVVDNPFGPPDAIVNRR